MLVSIKNATECGLRELLRELLQGLEIELAMLLHKLLSVTWAIHSELPAAGKACHGSEARAAVTLTAQQMVA